MRLLDLVLAIATVVSAAPPALADTSSRDSRPEAHVGGERSVAEDELGDDALLAGVVSLYEAGKYSQCAADLGALLQGEARRRLRDRDVLENARIYYAACLIGSGNAAAADEPLRDAIRANMQMKPPDSLVFPAPVIDRFLRVRQSLYEEIKRAEELRVNAARKAAEQQVARERSESARVAALEDLAGRESIVVKNRRWIGFVPFGVGQFQNGDDGLGWLFLTSEAALGATALTAIAMQSRLDLEASRLHNPANNAVLRTWHSLVVVSSYTWLGVAAAGILQAELAFVPEVREERKRVLPDTLLRKKAQVSLEPNFAAGPDSLFLGVSGRF
jgi:hypothetical protein